MPRGTPDALTRLLVQLLVKLHLHILIQLHLQVTTNNPQMTLRVSRL